MGDLGLAPDRQLLPPCVVGGRQAPRLHGIRGMPVATKLFLANVVGIPERGVRIADGRSVLEGHVGTLRLVDHGLALKRLLDVDQCMQGVVDDIHYIGGILRQVAAVCQYHCNRVPHVMHLTVRQRVLQEFQQVTVRPQTYGYWSRHYRCGDILEGKYIKHPRHFPCRAGVYGNDPRMGVRASNDGGVERIGPASRRPRTARARSETCGLPCAGWVRRYSRSSFLHSSDHKEHRDLWWVTADQSLSGGESALAACLWAI